MKKVVFSSVFEADFAEITAHMAADASGQVSERWEAAIIRLVELLQKFPELGRLRHDLRPDGIRSFWVKEFPNYLVFYRLDGNEIVFLRVRYGGMDLTTMFAGG
jgi:plasmid stabilization system protein ParE